MNAGYTTVDERADSYMAVTPERIRELANEIFQPKNLTLTIKGNKKKIDALKLEEIIKKL